MTRFVALLRGINVGAAGRGRKGVPMDELRELCELLGWTGVATYIQSGNVVFAADGAAAALASQLEGAIAERFGFEVAVIVRAAAAMLRAAKGGPFGAAAEERPNLVHIGFAKGKVAAAMAGAVEPYCTNGERVAVVGQAIWIDSPNGVARSKVTPAVLDRAFASPVTLRNVKTLRAIAEMLGE